MKNRNILFYSIEKIYRYFFKGPWYRILILFILFLLPGTPILLILWYGIIKIFKKFDFSFFTKIKK